MLKSVDLIIEKAQESKKTKEIAKRFERGLSITSQNEDGKLERRAKFLDMLFEDLDQALVEQNFTPDELVRVRKSFTKRMMAPGSVIALTCVTDCLYADNCELARMGKEPLGKKCPYEESLFSEYLARAVVEFDADPNDSVDLKFCNELASTDLLLLRVDMQLSKAENASLLGKKAITGRDSILEYEDCIHPLIETREKLAKRRDKIINMMVGDRREKYKKQAALKLKDDSPISKQQSLMANRIIEAKQNKEILEAESGIKEENVVTPDDILNEI